MFQRRQFLTCGIALAALPALPPSAWAALPTGGGVTFAVMRKGKKIGEHSVQFSTDGDTLTARALAQMSVAIGPVTVFRYRHSQVERWTGGKFAGIETNTTQNGQKIQLVAERTDAGVKITGGKGAKPLLPAATLPLTHWNRQALSGPLFNPQDGKVMRLSVTGQGPSSVALADGRQVKATRIALAGQTTIEDWYDAGGGWTALRAKADDGSIVEYRKL